MIIREPGDDSVAPILGGVEELSSRCLSAVPSVSWADACRNLSRLNGGQWFEKPGGATWRNGSRTLWIMDPVYVASLMEARAASGGLLADPPWSVGAIGRKLLAYVGEPCRCWDRLDWLSEDAGIGYRKLTPGRWPNGIMWDAKAYYHTLVTRLPSWRCLPGRSGTPGFLRTDKDEMIRRRDVESMIGSCKPLRNALWGAMLGSTRPMRRWIRGEASMMRGRSGPFRAAGLLVSRAAWELTRSASVECASVYTHTDCVTSVGGEYPSTWGDNGYDVRIKAEGETVVHHAYSVRVGLTSLKYYSDNDCLRESVPDCDAPRLYYGRGWAWTRLVA